MIDPQIREEVETGASHMWHDDPFAGGALALFDPSQETLLYEDIIQPEGRIHFTGGHASLYHAWIQGASESGLRTEIDIHQSPELQTKTLKGFIPFRVHLDNAPACAVCC